MIDFMRLHSSYGVPSRDCTMHYVAMFWRGEFGFGRQFWRVILVGLLIFFILYVLGHLLFFQTKVRFGQTLSLAFGFLWAGLSVVAVWQGAQIFSATLQRTLIRLCCTMVAACLVGLLAALFFQNQFVLIFTFPGSDA